MRYRWIELINYAGIYNGMNLNNIRIDFDRCMTNKIVIRGDNGSGKSTLMNAISPLADSNDKFIPTEEARKNICLTDNGIDYIIRYVHPVTSSGRGTTKGYITKIVNGNSMELNPNGNISSCNEILYDEFNLDSTFLSLSQLSSENRGLVDLKPAERKKIASKIINVLDVYNNIYKNLNKKSSTYKSLIQSIITKIDYIGDESRLMVRLNKLEDRLISLKEEEKTTIENIAAVKLKIGSYLDFLEENNYSDILSELKEVSGTVKSLDIYIDKQLQNLSIKNIDTVDEFLHFLEKKCIELETQISMDKLKIPEMLLERENEYKELQEKQERLKALESDKNYIDIKKAMSEAKEVVDKYSETIDNIGIKNIDIITKDEFDAAMESLHNLHMFANLLTNDYQVSMIEYVHHNIPKVKRDILDIPFEQRKLKDLETKLLKKQSELDNIESLREIADELDKRPKECKIDSCPFINYALEIDKKFPKERYDKVYDELEDLMQEQQDQCGYVDNLETYAEILKYLEDIEKEFKSNMRFIAKLPVRLDFEQTFIDRVIKLDPFNDLDELYKFIDCGNFLEEYKVAKKNLETYSNEFSIYKEKERIVQSMVSDIDNLNKRTTDLADKIDEINEDILKNEKTLASLQKDTEKVNLLSIKINEEYNVFKNKKKELEELKSSLDSSTSEMFKLNETLKQLEVNLTANNKDIESATKEKSDINHSLLMLNDYKKELASYNDKYSKIEKIRYYASPSTGIQTIYMQLYMNNLLDTANRLLGLLFNGEFLLQPFIINDNEFRIPCKGYGLMHDDISSMSTAQKCMISMILSFAILNQSSSKYNIIKLDEVDGALDTNNRSYFLPLLDDLMRILYCEQSFIISHNNELTNYNCDIILLKSDSSYDINGNIIWKY